MKMVLKIGLIVFMCMAMAQGAYAGVATVSVSPVTKTVTLLKGEAKSGVYTVKNNSDKELHVTVEPRYWYTSEKNKDIPLDAWLEIDPAQFDIGPKAVKDVKFNVKVPDGVKGELAAMIAFKPSAKEEQPVNIVFSVSLYVIALGTEKVECDIVGFKIWKHKDKKILGAKVGIENKGNIHMRPRITVYVQNLFRKNLQKAPLQYGKPIYPGGRQDYIGNISNFILKPGIYKAVIDTEYTNLGKRFQKKIYFLVGIKGRILFTFFRGR